MLEPREEVLLGVLAVQDTTQPILELLHGGRPFADGDHLAADEGLTVRASDDNGVPVGQVIRICVDGEELPRSRWRPGSSAPPEAIWQLDPDLDEGQHEIRIVARDCADNLTELVRAFRVSYRQKICFLGTYPNPFRDRTVFAFELSRRAERLGLTIFSADGRKIRTLGPSEASADPDLRAAGYHEIVWDGTDDEGEDVAYGVYFFRLAVLTEGKWYEHGGKVARVP